MSEERRLLWDKAVDQDAKFTYFLLAVAAAGIGYAVEKSDGLAQAGPWSMALAAGAVGLWGLSFASGCFKAMAVKAVLQLNLAVVEGRDLKRQAEQLGFNHQAMSDAIGRHEANMTKRGAAQRRWFNAQLVTLALGTCCFVAWRVLAILEQLPAKA